MRALASLLVLFAIFACSVALADDDADVKLPLVTLNMKSVPVNSVIDALSKQTGVKFRRPEKNGQRHPRVSIDLKDKTFSEALNTVCGKCRLCVQNVEPTGEIVLDWFGEEQGPFGKRPASVGPLATFVVDSITRNNALNYDADDPQPSHDINLTFSPYVDPRLHVIAMVSEPQIETATDENGDSILQQSASGGEPSTTGVEAAWSFQQFAVPLDYDPQKSKKLALLKGTLHVWAAIDEEMVKLDDLQKSIGTEKSVEGLRLVIDDAAEPDDQENADQHTTLLTFTLFREGMSDQLWSSVPNRIVNSVQIYNSQGKAIEHSINESNSDESKTVYSISTAWKEAKDRPAKASLILPSNVKEIDLPFEFHDLKLP
jgi:hypothetical protein